MPSTNGFLPKAELNRLLGGWTRFLNPFRSAKSRIEEATRNDPVLRRRALASVLREGSDSDVLIAPYWGSCLVLLSLVPMVHFLSADLMLSLLGLAAGINIVYGIGFLALSIPRRNRLRAVATLPALQGIPANTGWPELDAILDYEPFEAEETLLAGGMDKGDLGRLADLSRAMCAGVEGTRSRAHGLLLVHVSREVSPAAVELVGRAYAILDGGAHQPQALPRPSMLEALEHVGIRHGGQLGINPTLALSTREDTTGTNQ